MSSTHFAAGTSLPLHRVCSFVLRPSHVHTRDIFGPHTCLQSHTGGRLSHSPEPLFLTLLGPEGQAVPSRRGSFPEVKTQVERFYYPPLILQVP